MVVVATEESDGSALCDGSTDDGADDSLSDDTSGLTGAETATDPGTVVVVVLVDGVVVVVVAGVEASEDGVADVDVGAFDDEAVDDADPICAAGRTVVFWVTGGDERSAFNTVSRPSPRPRPQFSQS